MIFLLHSISATKLSMDSTEKDMEKDMNYLAAPIKTVEVSFLWLSLSDNKCL